MYVYAIFYKRQTMETRGETYDEKQANSFRVNSVFHTIGRVFNGLFKQVRLMVWVI